MSPTIFPIKKFYKRDFYLRAFKILFHVLQMRQWVERGHSALGVEPQTCWVTWSKLLSLNFDFSGPSWLWNLVFSPWQENTHVFHCSSLPSKGCLQFLFDKVDGPQTTRNSGISREPCSTVTLSVWTFILLCYLSWWVERKFVLELLVQIRFLCS